MPENGKTVVFWHLLTSGTLRKVSLPMAIWVSLEPYCSHQSTHRFKILKNERKSPKIRKNGIFMIFPL